MSLDKYKLPAVLREGFDHKLKDAPEVSFKIIPPLPNNKKFQIAVLRRLPSSQDVRQVNMLDLIEAQQEVFAEQCVVGWNRKEEFSAEALKSLFDEYPMILEELWTAAQGYSEQLQTGIDKEVKALKKR